MAKMLTSLINLLSYNFIKNAKLFEEKIRIAVNISELKIDKM